MLKKYTLFFFLFFLLKLFVFGSFQVSAQSKRTAALIGKAKTELAIGNFIKAESYVLQAINKDPTDLTAYLYLSDISDELKKPEQRKYALQNIIAIDSVNYPIAYKLLGNLCFNKGEYNEALAYYEKFHNRLPTSDPEFVTRRIASSKFAIQSLTDNRNVEIIHLSDNINSPLPEYWPAISTNDSVLYFTRLLGGGNVMAYERLFIADNEEGHWGKARQIEFPDEQYVNIGTMCISADEKLMFFTACGRKGGEGSCDIYYSKKQNGLWQNPVNAGKVLNSGHWEAQPSVSSDNKYLYFTSNRPGGYGGMDIWRCEITELKDGYLFFHKPINLGTGINTPSDDFSPFIHADGTTLYFSSEGHVGFGGSDIFISKFHENTWAKAVNLGFPINSRFNDDGLVVSPTAKVAVFSSNREGAIESSKDLYQFELPEPYLPAKVGYLKGFVVDARTGSHLQANIDVTRLDDADFKVVKSDVKEGYITTLNFGQLYSFHVNLEGYMFFSHHINLKDTRSLNLAETFDIYLEPITVGKKVVLSNIFFDFNSDTLKNESIDELQKLTLFIRNNPKIFIEVSGHTDNIGDKAYNKILSEKRAKAIHNYLAQYIDPVRISYKGYGMEHPIETNETDEGRAKNRRSEIEILSN
jgi:outer membrane protein OmpA-like peptidoglycan-associated protein/tetratricopeptide (TPR) repeat protein